MPAPIEQSDMAQDTSLIDQKIGELVQELAPVLEQILEKLNALEDRVEKDLIGGLKGAFEQKVKGETISGLKERHGGKFGDLISYLGTPHGADEEGFWDSVYGQLKSGQMDEEELMSAVLSHMNGLRDHYQGKKAEEAISPDAVVDIQASGEPGAVQEALEAVPEVAPVVTEPEEEPVPGSAKFFEKAAKGRKSKA